MNPLLGFRDVRVGVTMKLTPALGAPFAVTTTGPVAEPTGTVVVIWLAFQFAPVTVAKVPLKETVPGLDPKLLPEMITCCVPSQFEPDEHPEGDRPLLLITGAAVTVRVPIGGG